MGMDAELLAIGKYSPDLKGALEYQDSFYDGTPEGAEIIAWVCSCVSSRGSELLARAMGVDPWRFEQHCGISGEGADLSLIDEAAEDGRRGSPGEYRDYEITAPPAAAR